MERTTYFDGMVVLTDTYSMMHLIIFFFSLARRCWTGIIEVSWKLYIKKTFDQANQTEILVNDILNQVCDRCQNLVGWGWRRLYLKGMFNENR